MDIEAAGEAAAGADLAGRSGECWIEEACEEFA